jgi:hypothetical protein
VQARRMIRPEPPGANMAYEPSKFWDGRYAGRSRIFAVGSVVRIDANPPPAQFPFPHATEDRIVGDVTTIKVLRALDSPGTAAAVAAGVSPTLEAAFDNALVRPLSGKAYVPAGRNSRSLGAVEIGPNQLQLFQNTYYPKKPKLRARIEISGKLYDLPLRRTRRERGGSRAVWRRFRATFRRVLAFMSGWDCRGRSRQCQPNVLCRSMASISYDGIESTAKSISSAGLLVSG